MDPPASRATCDHRPVHQAGPELILAHAGDEREAYVQELEGTLLCCLEPLTRTS
ncbi:MULTISPECIES: hypothetical protein [Streptomyces]|uniref:hypothetical protein n=1 Tax=Streptomyces TaxID=1883 RepID=UPI0012FF06B8|nr:MULTISPECIES: hypothetical protein [Streptomyces]